MNRQSPFRTAYTLSILITVLAAVASTGGLFLSDLYRDNELVRTTWFANDLMTLVLVVPLLVVSLILAQRGSMRATLVWIAMFMVMLYNYAFYLFGAAFNRFFLIYVALFTLSIFGLIYSVPRLDAEAIARSFRAMTPVRWISGFMLFFALLLGGLWIAMTLGYVVSGQLPENIAKFDHPTSIVFALDLSLLVPGMVFGAILLWRRKPWGYIVAAIMNVKATTYALVLIITTLYVFVVCGTMDPLLPMYAFLGAGNLAATLFLLGNLQPAQLPLSA